MKELVLAVDAGGTFLKSALFFAGEPVEGTFYSVGVDSERGTAEQVRAAYEDIIVHGMAEAERLGGRVVRVAIDTPGPFDYQAGVPLMRHKYRAIYGISLIPWIRDAAGDVEVRFLHDSAAFILGASGDTPLRPLAGAMIGTGLGFALLGEDAVPLRRPDGGPLVSIYRTPLRGTTAEELISGRGIAARYNSALQRRGSDAPMAENAKQVGERAAAGDVCALDVYRETGALLGEVVRPILTEYGVRAFIVGGQVARSFDLMESGLREALAGVCTLEYIAPVSDIDNAHLRGAALA